MAKESGPRLWIWPLKWLAIGLLVGALSGTASAFFLWALDSATNIRLRQPGLLFALPLAGAAIGGIYSRWGRGVAGGNNLLLDEIHDPKRKVPFRMAPLILFSTVATHLFGGSAGREGTAVQMGGALADMAAEPFRLTSAERKLLLMAGMAAGFGSVFGTPFAGAIFGIEVLAIGSLRWEGAFPCLVASFAGDIVCRAWGIHHHAYDAPNRFSMSWAMFGWVALASLFFGLVSAGFAEATHAIQRLGKQVAGAAWVRPLVGGLVVVALTLAVGNQDYNGLGIPLIERAFHGDVPSYAFLLKLLFTAITLGAGYKGGEVTPLFCIGATLGSAFAGWTHQDPALFAALGFVAVFSGAANTPLACTAMGIELFGPALGPPLAIACFLAFMLSGHRGIYLSQKVHRAKVGHGPVESGSTLRTITEAGRAKRDRPTR